MKYRKVIPAAFISRPNRFMAKVRIGSADAPLETVHVKNTGRCKELLVPGCRVYLAESDNTARKTKYDLVAVEKNAAQLAGPGPLLINMDSQAPNDAAEEWLNAGGDGLFSESAIVRREVTFGSSRFDFYIEDGERKAFVEVKGVTLEQDGVVLFPDAPTERGVKHLHELCRAVDDGYECYLLLVIQMLWFVQ